MVTYIVNFFTSEEDKVACFALQSSKCSIEDIFKTEFVTQLNQLVGNGKNTPVPQGLARCQKEVKDTRNHNQHHDSSKASHHEGEGHFRDHDYHNEARKNQSNCHRIIGDKKRNNIEQCSKQLGSRIHAMQYRVRWIILS